MVTSPQASLGPEERARAGVNAAAVDTTLLKLADALFKMVDRVAAADAKQVPKLEPAPERVRVIGL